MKEDTGVVVLYANYIDYPNLRFCYACNNWCQAVFHEYMKHFGHEGPAKVGVVVSAIHNILYAFKYKKWPYNHQLFIPFNYSLIEREYKKNGNDKLLQIQSFMNELFDNYNQQVYKEQRIYK